MPALYSFGTGFAGEIVRQQRGEQEEAAKVAADERTLQNGISLAEARVTMEARINSDKEQVAKNQEINSILKATPATLMLPPDARKQLYTDLQTESPAALIEIRKSLQKGTGAYRINADNSVSWDPFSGTPKNVDDIKAVVIDRAQRLAAAPGNEGKSIEEVIAQMPNSVDRAVLKAHFGTNEEFETGMKLYMKAISSPFNPASNKSPVEFFRDTFGDDHPATLAAVKFFEGVPPEVANRDAVAVATSRKDPPPTPPEPVRTPSPTQALTGDVPAKVTPVGAEDGGDEPVVDTPAIQNLPEELLQRFTRNEGRKVGITGADASRELSRRRKLERDDAEAAAAEEQARKDAQPLSQRSSQDLQDMLLSGKLPPGVSPEQLMQQIARTGVTQTDGDPRVSNGIAMSKAALANQSATMEQIIAQIDGATSLTDKQKTAIKQGLTQGQ